MTQTNVIPKSRAKTAYGLLSEVRRLILAEPKRYDQTTFIARDGEAWCDGMFEYPSCGTIGCVAGWVATLKGPAQFDYSQVSSIAQDIIGIPCGDLFSPTPFKFGKNNPQTLLHARDGAAHIERFQKRYRRQLLAKKV